MNQVRRKAKSRVAWTILGIGVLAALVLSACGGSSGGSSSGGAPTASSGALSTSKSNPNATMIVNVATPIATLDPTFTLATQEVGLDGALYSTLTKSKYTDGPVQGTTEAILDVNGIEPYLAESWKYSNGNKTLTFRLHPNLKFPSGDPLNAEAVKWSLERTVKAKSGGYSVLEENDFKPPLIKSIEAPNPTTVVLNYKRPAPNQLQVLSTPTAGAIYDPKVVEENGGQKEGTPNEYLGTHSAGYGPYLLKSYKPNHEMVLEANPDFFEPAKTKNVIIRFVPDNETLLLDAQSGQADVTLGLSFQAAKSLEGNGCCTVAAFKSRQAQTLNFPINELEPFKSNALPEFKNQKFRQALATAFPYEAILEKVAYGYGQTYNGEWMPAFSWYDPKIGAPLETNIEKAKELMAESGVKTPVSFPIYVSQGAIVEKEIATAAAGAWEELGVNATVQTTSPAKFLEVVYETHDGVTVFIDGPQVIAPDYYWSYDLQCPPNNAFNDTDVCVRKSDAAMKKIPYTTKEPQRQELLNEANLGWIDATPRIWVYNQDAVAVLGKDMTEYASSDLPEVRLWAKG
ncbi:MAG: ABC transporter substrate-binding protein [Actinobacteria bacterium]|nr:ABC transporter substrate-binding protein [Actinomycetota bacterium]